jgi:hypothetical protein
MIKLLTVLVAIMLSGPVLAKDFATFGNRNCGEWVRDQTVSNKAWLVGFLSGINVTGITDDSLKKIQSTSQIYLWMDNYCKANPLQMVSDGAYKLLAELVTRK